MVVAYSGGADSLALLALLARLPMGSRLEAEAIHVDHGLRQESAEDAGRAALAAEALGFPCRIVAMAPPARTRRGTAPSGDEARIIPAGSGGLEAVARIGRYAALAEAAEGRPILTAHTADDQAETVLYRLAKGTGNRGIAGIRPRLRLAGAVVARPLLEADRALLREVAQKLELPVVEDPSNRSRQFARNLLRLDVLPELEAAIPGAAGRLARAARLAAADERYLERRTELASRRLEREGGVDAAGLLRLPEALRGRLVRRLVEQAGGTAPSAAQCERILGIARRGGELHLRGGLLASARGGLLQVRRGITGRRSRTNPAPPASDKS